jgi:flavin reductase (DIM6/NTAB) family NADH-FMN oxidoreductase RutF
VDQQSKDGVIVDGSVAPAELRRAMGHFATGVAIVTARNGDGEAVGTTVNAVTSLSLEPPLVLVCFDLASETLQAVRDHGAFAVNVLAETHRELADGFARRGSPKPWDQARHRAGATGVPRLEGMLAAVECVVEDHLAGGDHEIVVGRVVEVHADGNGVAPLLFYRGGYAALPSR